MNDILAVIQSQKTKRPTPLQKVTIAIATIIQMIKTPFLKRPVDDGPTLPSEAASVLFFTGSPSVVMSRPDCARAMIFPEDAVLNGQQDSSSLSPGDPYFS